MSTREAYWHIIALVINLDGARGHAACQQQAEHQAGLQGDTLN